MASHHDLATSDAGSSSSPAIDLPESSMDMAIFEQILEMDDDEVERDFSRSIIFDFFQQAEQTFRNMDDKIQSRDLEALSQLGHFLKGSSATLGLTKVKDSCEKIQHYGARKDETGTRDEQDDEVSLARLKTTIAQARAEFREVEQALRRFYGDDPSAAAAAAA